MSIDLYLAPPLLVGNEGMPGAPLLHLHLAIDASTGEVIGLGEIDWGSVQGFSDVRISELTGQIHSLGLGPAVRVIAVQGTYNEPFGPKEPGHVIQKFSAVLGIGQDNWKGHGSFTFGPHEVKEVPVKPVKE